MSDQIWIPQENMPSLVARIAKLNKRAAKLGCDPIELIIGAPVAKTLERAVRVEGDHFTRRVMTKVYPIAVAGSPPKINGWTFLGTVQLIDGQNIVRSVPGAEIPVEHRTATDWCDHCQSRRGRKDVFVVRHDDGHVKVVGRNCLADFLGHESPEAIAWRATTLASLNYEIGDYECLGGGNWRDHSYPLDEFVAAAACAVREFGWKKADHDAPTKFDAIDIMFPFQAGKDRKLPKPTDDDWRVAEHAIAWAEAIPSDTSSGYLYNLRAIATNGSVDFRGMGIAASLPATWLREQGRLAEQKAAQEQSRHFGTVKKRDVYTLTVVKVIDLEGMYGTTHVHVMHDSSGNVAKWSTGTVRLEEGQTYRIKATVKEHAIYRDIAQTVLSRCDVQDTLHAAA